MAGQRINFLSTAQLSQLAELQLQPLHHQAMGFAFERPSRTDDSYKKR
jgi:hypothetical protein